MAQQTKPHRRVLTLAVAATGLALAGCSAHTDSMHLTGVTCQVPTARRWAAEVNRSAGADRRQVKVWLDLPRETTDGWASLGGSRMRRALELWNSLGLPARLVPARSVREAEITVDIIPHFPREPELRGDQYRAGLTHLAYDSEGRISRARVFIAQSTPYGRHYALVDQEATLLHELGHALGLPHATHPLAIMAATPRSSSITPMDVALARSVYRDVSCPRSHVAAGNPEGR